MAIATAAACLAAVLAHAASPSARRASPPPTGTPVLTVMTYNVNYGWNTCGPGMTKLATVFNSNGFWVCEN